jgi:hypothetical protein
MPRVLAQGQPARVDTKATKDTKIAKKVEIALRAKRIQEIFFAIFVSFVTFALKSCSRPDGTSLSNAQARSVPAADQGVRGAI